MGDYHRNRSPRREYQRDERRDYHGGGGRDRDRDYDREWRNYDSRREERGDYEARRDNRRNHDSRRDEHRGNDWDGRRNDYYTERDRGYSDTRRDHRRDDRRDERRRDTRREKKEKKKKRSESEDEGSSGHDDTVGHYEGQAGAQITERYKVLGDAGLGTFGRVLDCMDLKENKRVAMKVLTDSP